MELVNERNDYVLTGVTGDSARAIGTTNVNLGICNNIVKSRFPFIVCDNNLLATYDGLLGRDFLKKNGAQVDYALDCTFVWGQCLPLISNDIPPIYEPVREIEKQQEVKEEVDSVESCHKQLPCSAEFPINVQVEEYGYLSDTDEDEYLYKRTFKQRDQELKLVGKLRHEAATHSKTKLCTMSDKVADLVFEERQYRSQEDTGTSPTIQKREIEHQNEDRFPVKINEDLIIPPRCEINCVGEIGKVCQNADNIWIEPCHVGQSGVMIANTLADSAKETNLRIANVSNEQVIIKANTVVAYAVANVEVMGSEPECSKEEINVLKAREPEKFEVNEFNLTHLDNHTKEMVIGLIQQYQDIFSEGDAKLSSTTKVKHRIITENVPPITIQIPSKGNSSTGNRSINEDWSHTTIMLPLVRTRSSYN